MERPKLKLKRQGTAIVEYDDENGYAIGLPDGSVEFATSRKGVEKIAKKWSKENIPAGYNGGLLEIDYRSEGPRKNPDQDQFSFHLKPTGWTGAPCPICGCATPNLRARHRALKADEAHRWGVPYIKRVKVSFGTDFSDEPLKE
jgi:hypothetical protein